MSRHAQGIDGIVGFGRDRIGYARSGGSIAVPTAKRYVSAGYYPNGYRVGYDAQAKEYRITLTLSRTSP